MSGTPSVLIADDGQLDRAVRILETLGVHPERVCVSKLRGEPVRRPRDLLLMAWHPTRELPELAENPEGSEPVRVCLHSQDFLPLRERLKELGVDYLVQTSLDDDSLRRFLQTLLHRGPERRTDARLPLGGTVTLRSGDASERVRLADLSRTTCRVLVSRALALDAELTLVLPRGLGGNAELELPARVVRCEQLEAKGSAVRWSVLVRFEAPAEAVREQLERIARGEQIGTRATPLGAHADPEPDPEADPEAEAWAEPLEPEPHDRRGGAERRPYTRRVALLEWGGADHAGLALGRDLSLSGVGITGGPPVPVGSVVTLALYGEARAEPVVVEATVVRAGGNELGLEWSGLDDAQRRAIETLMSGPNRIESLRAGAAGRRIVSRIVRR